MMGICRAAINPTMVHPAYGSGLFVDNVVEIGAYVCC